MSWQGAEPRRATPRKVTSALGDEDWVSLIDLTSGQPCAHGPDAIRFGQGSDGRAKRSRQGASLCGIRRYGGVLPGMHDSLETIPADAQKNLRRNQLADVTNIRLRPNGVAP